MNLYEQLREGETVEMRIGAIITKSKIERIDSATHFVVTQPTHKLLPVAFDLDEQIEFFFFRNNGVYSFRAAFSGRAMMGKMRVCAFTAVTDMKKSQRRLSFRLAVPLSMTLRRKSQYNQSKAVEYPAFTINISQEGALFSCPSRFPVGARLLLEIKFSATELCIVNAEVLRCELPLNKDDPYLIGVKFVNLTKHDQSQIAKFILNTQIDERRRKQLED